MDGNSSVGRRYADLGGCHCIGLQFSLRLHAVNGDWPRPSCESMESSPSL